MLLAILPSGRAALPRRKLRRDSTSGLAGSLGSSPAFKERGFFSQ